MREHQQREFADIEWVRRQLVRWAERCGICEGAGDRQSRHDIRQCWRTESIVAKKLIKDVDKRIVFKD